MFAIRLGRRRGGGCGRNPDPKSVVALGIYFRCRVYLLVDLVGLPRGEVLFGRGGDIGHGVEVAARQVEVSSTPSAVSIRSTEALFRLAATTCKTDAAGTDYANITRPSLHGLLR